MLFASSSAHHFVYIHMDPTRLFIWWYKEFGRDKGK